MGRRNVRWLYAITTALAAGLTFSLQPLIAKWVLPRFGGTPAVWTTVALFFQAALLAAYGLAHVAARFLRGRGGLVAQLAMLSAGALVLPLDLPPPDASTPASAAALALGVVTMLAVAVAIPAVAVLGTAPSLQRWFSGIEDAGDPYPLYAASNIGSMGGLLAYPLVIEPWLGLKDQAVAWSFAYGAVAALTLACAWAARDSRPPPPDGGPPLRATACLRWVAWSALPAANVLAVTAHITTDLAPVPLLWVVPMAIYLASWALAFSRWGPLLTELALRMLPVAAAGMAPLILLSATSPTVGVTLGHIAWLGVSSLAFHGAIAGSRPPPRHLTAFYLWLALGGVVGGAVVAVVAPAVTSTALDYPLLTVALLVAMPQPTASARPRARWLGTAAATVLFGGLLLLAEAPAVRGFRPPLWPFAILVLLFAPTFRRPRVAAAALGLLIAAATITLEARRPVEVARRSFFASYRVVHDATRSLRWLAHGRTIHGAESQRPDLVGQCLPYHHPNSPAAAVLGVSDKRVAVVGLGIGCMAALPPAPARIDFIEVDPVVVELATDHFGALHQCGDRCDVLVGDGRAVLGGADTKYDLIVLDAFASDAVPVHLLTVEAMQTYLAHLAPHGRLAFHITNQHVHLEGIVAAAAVSLGLHGRLGVYDPSSDRDTDPQIVADYYAATRWAVLAREGVALTESERPGLHWRPLAATTAVPWTDRRASIWDAL